MIDGWWWSWGCGIKVHRALTAGPSKARKSTWSVLGLVHQLLWRRSSSIGSSRLRRRIRWARNECDAVAERCMQRVEICRWSCWRGVSTSLCTSGSSVTVVSFPGRDSTLKGETWLKDIQLPKRGGESMRNLAGVWSSFRGWGVSSGG